MSLASPCFHPFILDVPKSGSAVAVAFLRSHWAVEQVKGGPVLLLLAAKLRLMFESSVIHREFGR